MNKIWVGFLNIGTDRERRSVNKRTSPYSVRIVHRSIRLDMNIELVRRVFHRDSIDHRSDRWHCTLSRPTTEPYDLKIISSSTNEQKIGLAYVFGSSSRSTGLDSSRTPQCSERHILPYFD